MHKSGTLKRLGEALDLATAEDAERLFAQIDAWHYGLRDWTPRSRVEIVQACNIARHFIRGSAMFYEGPEMVEAAEDLLACLHGIIVNVRCGSRDVARSMRMLRRSPAGRRARDAEAHALAAIGRAANPYLTYALDTARTAARRRAA